MARGAAISVYINKETLNRLDRMVTQRAETDKQRGLTGYEVTSRSSMIAACIDAFYLQQQNKELSIHDIKEAVAPIAKEYGIDRISLYGSYARGEETDSSDINLMLERGKLKGLQVFDFRDELQEALGKTVNLMTTQEASNQFLERISKDEILLFESKHAQR